MTMGGAYSMSKEMGFDSLEKGTAADLIVLDRNIPEIDPHSLIDTKVVRTVSAGKIAYDASARASTAPLPGRRQGRLR